MAIIPYDRITNLQNDQALAPTDPYPAQKLDQEYNAIKITTDDLIQHLGLIQRDDGQLANDSVGADQIRDEILIGFDAPLPWQTNHDYIPANTVFADNAFWYCTTPHTSNSLSFSPDYALGYWSLIANFTDAASQGARMYVGDAPPALPIQGTQWFEADTGNTFLYYEDGTSSQWIHTNGGAGASFITSYPQTGNFWTDVDPAPPVILRGPDRVFFGQAVSMTGNRHTDMGIPPWQGGAGNYAGFVPRDSDVVSMSLRGAIAMAGLSQTIDGGPEAPACIGVAGVVLQNTPNGSAWALYADATAFETAGFTVGLEMAVKNMSPLDWTLRPYQTVTLNGVYGVWAAGGGDAIYGAPTHPSTAAFVVLRNSHTWNTGIVMQANALTRVGDPVTGAAIAIHMAMNHQIIWDAPDGVGAAAIASVISNSATGRQLLFTDGGFQFNGQSGQPAFSVFPVASGVDYIGIAGAAAGGAPNIFAAGISANIAINLTPKGVGPVWCTSPLFATSFAFTANGATVISTDGNYHAIKNKVGNNAINIGTTAVGDSSMYFNMNRFVFLNETGAAAIAQFASSGLDLVVGADYRINNVKVVGARSTGWAAQTATPSQANLGATPTVGQLASWAAAIDAALKAHGLLGT